MVAACPPSATAQRAGSHNHEFSNCLDRLDSFPQETRRYLKNTPRAQRSLIQELLSLICILFDLLENEFLPCPALQARTVLARCGCRWWDRTHIFSQIRVSQKVKRQHGELHEEGNDALSCLIVILDDLKATSKNACQSCCLAAMSTRFQTTSRRTAKFL